MQARTEAFRLGDRISVLHEGRLRQTGPEADLTAAPADEFVRSFLASHLVVGGR